MPLLSNRDPRGCTQLGPLDEFVQALDAGSAARSLHHLAGQLHRALGRPAEMRGWVSAVRARFDATSAVLFELHGGDLHVIADPTGASSRSPAVDAMRAALNGRKKGEAVVYSTASSDSAASEPWRASGAAVLSETSRILGLVIVRPGDAAAQETAVLQYLAAMAWHLACAAHGAAELDRLSQRLSPSDLVELLPLPCVLTDEAGRSIERNEAFGRFMQAAGMHISTGRLGFRDAYLQDSWLVALAEVRSTAVRQSLLVSAQDASQWQVHFVPLPWGIGEGGKAESPLILAMVEQVAADADLAMDRLLTDASKPLTPAESEVLNALLQGHSAKVIANARGASVNTVRSQIMAILDKTGHHNQKSLIAAFAPSGFRSSIMSAFSSAQAGMPGPKR